MSLYNTILLIGIVQGIFLTLGLFIKNYDKKKQNLFFLSLVSMITLAMFSKILYSQERYLAYPHIWYIPDVVAYAIGPLWYFTIHKSISPKVKLKTSDWLLLSPILYHIFFLVYIFTLDKETLLGVNHEEWFLSFYLFCLTVLVVNGGFLLKANLTLKQHRDSQFPELLIQGQYVFLAILVFWLLSFISSFVLNPAFIVNPTSAYNYAFISFAFLTFGMAFLALVRPASFYFLTQTFDSGETYVLQQIAEKAVAFIQEKEPFLKSNFSLNELSTEIQSNPVLTSKAINRILKSTYNDLMNEYRVKYFLQLAREERMKNLTHWAIAREAGFGNKVSFYKAFKKMMGTTPKVYLASEVGE